MLEAINDMRMEQDHEIMECDKVEYNELLGRVKKYHNLSKELQDKHHKAFMKLLDAIDNLISNMDVDNITMDEFKNGFKLKGDA